MLAYFEEKIELAVKLPLSWKQDCQEYKSICKIIKRLDKLSLVLVKEQPMNIFHHHSINNDDSHSIAESSSEITPLIIRPFQRRSPSFTNFYRSHYGAGEVRSSLSPMPEFSNSNQMRV